MLVSVINFGPGPQFSLVPLHNFVAGQRGSIGRDSLLPNTYYDTPGHLRLSPSLPTPYERGECPSWLLPRICPRGISGAPGPIPRIARAHLTIPVAWTRGLLWPTSPCPGCPLLSTHLSTATLPAGQWTPAPFKEVSCLLPTPTTKRPPFGKFNEPTN